MSIRSMLAFNSGTESPGSPVSLSFFDGGECDGRDGIFESSNKRGEVSRGGQGGGVGEKGRGECQLEETPSGEKG